MSDLPSTMDLDVETLVTAQEAFPRLEALFLGARSSVEMGFRLFDPRTRLRSAQGQTVGKTWADLFLHTINRGVSISLTLSDFDPVMANDLHVDAWKFHSICCGINEVAKPGAAQITVRCMLHPAQGGIIPRLMFAVATRRQLARLVAGINTAPDPARLWRSSPGLHDMVKFEDGRARVRLLALPRLNPVSLHHKMAVFDGQTTYIGGLDLNERRYDSNRHEQASQQTWHDVQLVIKDTALAQDAARFLATLPEVTAGHAPPPRIDSVLRTTLSRKRTFNRFALAPKGISMGLLKAHLRQIRAAKHLIYLETQYFRDRRIAKALAKAARRNPDLRLLLLIPGAPEEVAFQMEHGLDAKFGEYLQARAIRQVRKAFGPRFLTVSPAQTRRPDDRDIENDRAVLGGAPIIYVHAKVSIFDDTAAIVSSANLNGRSMKWDAEAGVLLTGVQTVRSVRDKVFGHWLGGLTDAAYFDPKRAFAAWHSLAYGNAALPPEARTGFILPHAVRPAAAMGWAVPGAPEEMV